MRNAHKSNVDILTDIMEFSEFGALAQLFIMDAVSQHAELVASASIDELKIMEGGQISPAAWQATAAEIAQKLREHLNGGTPDGGKLDE